MRGGERASEGENDQLSARLRVKGEQVTMNIPLQCFGQGLASGANAAAFIGFRGRAVRLCWPI